MTFSLLTLWAQARTPPQRHWALLCAALLMGCSAVNPYYDASKAHHRPQGFTNLHLDSAKAEKASFWRWQYERWRNPPPASQPQRIPTVKPDLAQLQAPSADVSVTWIGHSTALWRINGINLLTDPHFSERASPVQWAGPRRETALPLQLRDLPRIDVVLISHNHYDHLDLATVRALNQQAGGPPLFVVPLGVDLWMQKMGITRVQKMDWWDHTALAAPNGALTLHFVPAQHWSSRLPWDRNTTLWGGYVLQGSVGGAPYSMYFAGDTGYSPDFAAIGQRFGGFDFAQIPVGCYLPRWFMRTQHVNEADAVQIHLDVKSRLSMGVHWGSFRLCDDPIEAPLDGLPQALANKNVAPSAFALWALGETRVLKRAQPTPP